MSEQNTMNDLMSFLSQDSQADTEGSVQSQDEVYDEELDTEDSHDEDEDYDGSDEYEDDEDSTADDEDESEDDDFDDEEEESLEEDESTESKATKFDDEDFTITVDGEELTVKGSELKSGYMRREAFTKKTQEVAEQRKSLDAELNKAVERSNAVKFNASIEMEKLDGVLKQLGGWDGLRRQATPEQYEQFTQRYVQAKRDSELADDIYNETVNSMRSNNAKQIENILKEMPKRHSNFSATSINEMDKFLSNRGFTEDMVLSMTSPDAWDIIFEAMQYNKLQTRTKETVKAEKTKKVKNRKHTSAPVKQSHSDGGRKEYNKALKAQRNSTGREHDRRTQDLLKKFL